MTSYSKELTPIEYCDSGIKVLHFFRLKNGKCFPMHWHDRMELIRVKSGSIHLEFGDKHLDVNSGQMAIFPPKMPHRGSIPNEDVIYDVLMFDVRSFFNNTEICKRYFSAIFDGRAKFCCVSENPLIIRCIDEIVAEKVGNDLLVVSKVYQLLSLLVEHTLLEMSKTADLDSFGQETLKFIHDHYRNEITTKLLSGRFGYSPEHFCRKFKEVTWLSPMKYLQIYRLERAAEMLKEKKRSVAEVAVDCGFSDQNYFARCFKAHFGVSPSKY